MRDTRHALALVTAAALLAVGCSRRTEGTAPAEAPSGPAPASSFATPPASKDGPNLAGTPYETSDRDRKAAAAAEAEAAKPVRKFVNGKLVEDHSPPVLLLMSEFGDESGGTLTVQAFPGDVVYMGLTVQTEGGTPIKGQAVTVTPSQMRTRAVLMKDATDREGYIEFHVMAGAVGRDTIVVTSAGVSRRFVLDVKKPERSEWLGKLDLDGVTSWDLFMAADVKLERDRTESQFPVPLRALDDKPVRVVGFMLPLESTEKQKHFLLSANPPTCFFHPPGGPSSVIEVFADKGVAADFDPMIVEGRLELVENSQAGILYKLHGAKLIAK